MFGSGILIVLFLFAGVIISFSVLSLFVSLYAKESNLYLRFGLMGLCVSVYIMLIPVMELNHGYDTLFKLAISFYILNFTILPWFICSYTGYCYKPVQLSISAILVISILLLWFVEFHISGYYLWNIVGHIGLLLIVVFGIYASILQKKKGDRNAGIAMLIVMLVFALLTIDDIFRMQFGKVYIVPSTPYILPLDYFLLMFLLIIGFRIVRDIGDKYIFEKRLYYKNENWSRIINNVKLFVFSIGENKKFEFVNPSLLDITGYSPEELINEPIQKLIFDDDERMNLCDVDVNRANYDKLRFIRTKVRCKNNDVVLINWSLIGVYDDDGKRINSVLIGSDITDEINAYEEISKLKALLEEEILVLKSDVGHNILSKSIIGNSDSVKYVLKRSMQVADTDTTVLIEGETGVGKELVANYIQRNSKRSERPFIKLNCSAIPSSLLESELFGYEKGAFTGANRRKKGLVQLANNGTLFLDEIDDFPIDLQPKLLRLLHEGEFMPLGSEERHKTNVRIIAATNKSLLNEIEKGNFRNDLYYRLYVYPITIPPLRKRNEDIEDLANAFIKKYSSKHKKTISRISKQALNKLKDYSWPGNIRELENIIEQAAIICSNGVIKSQHINLDIASNTSILNDTSDFITLADMEINYIKKVLKKTDGKISGKNGAAQILGMNPNTLRSRIIKYGINK